MAAPFVVGIRTGGEQPACSALHTIDLGSEFFEPLRVNIDKRIDLLAEVLGFRFRPGEARPP
jgi:hypothetical protein